MSFLKRRRWVLLLAAVMAIAIPGISYAQFDIKGRAADKLTDGVMKELEKKFTDIVAKESISPAAKAIVVKKLSEMTRPTVRSTIDGAMSGKLPNQTEVVNTVFKDILPRMPDLIAGAVAEAGSGGSDVRAVPAGTASSAGLTAASASSAINYDDEKDFTVEIISDSNTARITRYVGKNTELKIPPRIGGRLVTEIGERAFVKKGLVSVVIPDSVIFIGNMAFADNQIGSVSIGANVYIANNAFENTGYNSFSAGFYNNQGRKAGTYSNSWRMVSAGSPQPAAQPASKSGAAASASKPAAAASAASSDSTVVFAGNGHKYEVIDKSMNWTKAKEDCEKRGGYLATITSSEEQEFIEDLLSKKGKQKVYWLGGYRGSKGLTWVTDEEFSYKNWVPGMPNGSGEKIVIYRVRPAWATGGKPGQWDDTPGSGTTGYICEWD